MTKKHTINYNIVNHILKILVLFLTSFSLLVIPKLESRATEESGPQKKILILFDSSKSMGQEQISKASKLFFKIGTQDKLAKVTTFILYPTSQGPRILNFRNSTEVESLLSSLVPSIGYADVKQVLDLATSWSNFYPYDNREVYWFTDGGGFEEYASSTGNFQVVSKITERDNWTIYDLSQDKNVSKYADKFGNYFYIGNTTLSEISQLPFKDFNSSESKVSEYWMKSSDNPAVVGISISLGLAVFFLFGRILEFFTFMISKKRRKLVLGTSKKESKTVDSFKAWKIIPNFWKRDVSQFIELIQPNSSEFRKFLYTFFSLSLSIALIGTILGNYFIAIFSVFCIMPIFSKYAIRVKNKIDNKKFADALPSLLLVLSGGLRSGLALEQGIDAYCKSNDTIVSKELRRAMAEVNFGLKIENALEDLATRRDNQDLKWVVTAISVQRQVGGSLSEILDTVVETIKDRSEIRREIRTLAAEGKLSAYILIALPIGIFLFLFGSRRSYLEVLWQEPVGIMVLGLIVVLITIGWFWMKKVIDIKV